MHFMPYDVEIITAQVGEYNVPVVIVCGGAALWRPSCWDKNIIKGREKAWNMNSTVVSVTLGKCMHPLEDSAVAGWKRVHMSIVIFFFTVACTLNKRLYLRGTMTEHFDERDLFV